MKLSNHDASFLYAETASGPMHSPGVTIIEGEVPFEQVYEHTASRLHLVPMFRKRLAFVPFNLGHPRWVDDPEFDLGNHLTHHVLPTGSTFEDGVQMALQVGEPLLDRAHPLWKMAVIEGVPDRTILMYTMHHAMLDGAGAVDLTTVLFDFEPDAKSPPPPAQGWEPEPPPTPFELLRDALSDRTADLLRGPMRQLAGGWTPDQQELLRTANSITNRLASIPVIQAPWNAAPIGPKRKLAWTTVPIDDFRTIRTGLGGTINDVALTVVSEAAARYLLNHDQNAEGQYLRLMCPVNVRREDEKGVTGNRVSAFFPTLPAWPMEIAERHEHVMAEVGRAKEAREPQAFELFVESNPIDPGSAAQSLLVGTPLDPTAIQAQFPAPLPPRLPMRQPHFGYNLAVTNVPGVRMHQYLAGHKILEGVGAPPLTGALGASVAVASYAQQISISVQGEARLMPDVDHMRDLIAEVFEEMLHEARARAPKRKASRRRPRKKPAEQSAQA